MPDVARRARRVPSTVRARGQRWLSMASSARGVSSDSGVLLRACSNISSNSRAPLTHTCTDARQGTCTPSTHHARPGARSRTHTTHTEHSRTQARPGTHPRAVRLEASPSIRLLLLSPNRCSMSRPVAVGRARPPRALPRRRLIRARLQRRAWRGLDFPRRASNKAGGGRATATSAGATAAAGAPSPSQLFPPRDVLGWGGLSRAGAVWTFLQRAHLARGKSSSFCQRCGKRSMSM